MIFVYLATKLQDLAQTMRQQWESATTPQVVAPIPAWDDFQDLSQLHVNQFPIISIYGYEPLILEVLEAKDGQPEKLHKLADKLQTMYFELMPLMEIEGKMEIMDMTSRQIHQIRELAKVRPAQAPAPYN